MKLKTDPRFRWLLAMLVLIAWNCSDPELQKQNLLDVKETITSRDQLPKHVLDSTLEAESKVVKQPEGTTAREAVGQTDISVNYARQATVRAESTYPGYSVTRINDGSRNTTVGPSYSWANNHPGGGKLPESVFLRFSETKTINRMDIYTSSGYAMQNYTIQYRSTLSETWKTIVVVTGNTSVYRLHTFTTVNAIEIQIICQLGPSNQTIYGRLNEVEIYGTTASLPPISVVNGMLSFNSQSDVIQTLDYLEFKYDQYDDAFLAQYPGRTDDELAAIEESIGYNDEQPYINFENQFGIYSKRAQLTAAEDYWLATTPDDYPNQYENPDYTFVEDDEVRAIINNYGEVKVGATFYRFNSDGTHYEVPQAYYNELVALRDLKEGQAPPPHVKLNTSTPYVIFPNPCRSSERYRDKKTNGNWRIDHVTSIWNHPWRSRIMAKTKSYKKVNGRWKKRRSTIGAQVWGDVKNKDCAGNEFLQSEYVEKRKKKVKSKRTSGITIRAQSGDIKSFHYGGNVGNYNITLTW